MKLTATAALLAAAVSTALGQGTIEINNRSTGVSGVVAPIYGPSSANPTLALSGNATTNGGTIDYTGHPLLMGTGFTAELWAGDDAGSLAPVAQTWFRNTIFAGFFFPVPGRVSDRPYGTPTMFQLRAWDNAGGTLNTWAEVLMHDDSARGMSTVFGPLELGADPGIPPRLIGLTSFSIAVAPEPSMVVLGAIGLGALLLARRNTVEPSRFV